MRAEILGWLLDVYTRPSGELVCWLLGKDGQRWLLPMDFPVTFYAGGRPEHLRQAWRAVTDSSVQKARAVRADLFGREQILLSLTAPTPGQAGALYHQLSTTFPHLDYYDADVPLGVRFMAYTGVPLLGYCRFQTDGQSLISLEPLESPWELVPSQPPLRVMELTCSSDPALKLPSTLMLHCGTWVYHLALQPLRAFLANFQAILQRYDPDVILTDYGDAWFFAFLRESAPHFNPNRDPIMPVAFQRERSLFAYGQVLYRARQAHLFGRWHIDRCNAALFGEIGLEGVLELARVTGLGVQEAARKSPGAGITAMQMHTALRDRVLIPVAKAQAETPRTLNDLIQHDRGGLIYQPLIGVHKYVAEIDFTSMYPYIMVNHNISPETLGYHDATSGLVPRTLRPLLEKRTALKRFLCTLDRRDCRVPLLQARQKALKWLLVVCFGYLGYKNARFGRVESHEAVTGISRELLLQSKEVAEELGFTVLHMYVDSLFVWHAKSTREEDFTPLLLAIERQTGIPVTLEGVYQWLVFPPARRHPSIPVPNRYFGAFNDGRVKVRGLALRRHDTPRFVAETQWHLLSLLAQSENPEEHAEAARAFAKAQLSRLARRDVPAEDLKVAVKLRQRPEICLRPGPAAQAARQLHERGVTIRPGMRLFFWFTRQGISVTQPPPEALDLERYARLVQRAVDEVLEVFKPPPPLSLQLRLDSFAFPACTCPQRP
ncbi:DNA polymerase elongation subunit [Anaerolinea thermolimosa]|uniref:DNA polymerase domain-containing protein n=1 Tax=Anaerolinea thermolimosa TaxID=229919 RepID=UPI000784C00E|nr:DNA polymerase domain-containing protein [Anaerolinea thermolimosa]GAP06446.1 DNA polymerase elongation subunit [Anaerolinea thermolimosa]